jgi:hypothetical protein
MAERTHSAVQAPTLGSVVLDCAEPRALAEFYRVLFDLQYAPGDEPPAGGEPDSSDWLVLRTPEGGMKLAFQQIDDYREPTWPEGPRPQMVHLDSHVPTVEDLSTQRERALSLGARELLDRSADEDEPLYVFADPAGHPFCIFVG